jgi:hypothetical protein
LVLAAHAADRVDCARLAADAFQSPGDNPR